MTVIPFSLARFTPSDIAEFQAIADPRLQRGLWAGVARQTTAEGDRLIITFPNIERPVFSFERDRRGTYNLWFHDRQGWHSIGTGRTAGECLSIWRPRAAAASAAAAG